MSALLSGLYAAGVRFRNALYARNHLRIRQLEGPVISVGNLSVGGSGKTPFVILLGSLLRQRGLSFDVLSRGYGRSSRGVRVVDPDGSAGEFGDEPLLIARKLGVGVIVGENRYEAGREAERRFGAQIHVLDDGFQHRALARDFDVVMLSPEDLHDRLLPAGRLREPLRALSRADAVVIPEEADPAQVAAFGKPVWRVRRRIHLSHTPPGVAAFCGVAKPQRFFDDLRAAGAQVVAAIPFGDHHRYTERDIGKLLRVRHATAASGFVTTEKDAVNLGFLAEKLQPLTIAALAIELLDSERLVEAMLDSIRSRTAGRPESVNASGRPDMRKSE